MKMRGVLLGPALAIGLALMLSGCGDDATSGSDTEPTAETTSAEPTPTETPATQGDLSAADLDGTTFLSEQVTGHDLVADTRIRLSFTDGNLGVEAGCNHQGGAYEVAGGRLVWTGAAASTQMGCPEDLHAQDEWLAGLFTDGVEISGDATALTLTSGDVTIALSGHSGADLSEVLGTTWTLTGLADGDGVSSLPRQGRTPKLKVGADGEAKLDTGCNRGHTTVTVEGDSLGFSPPGITKMACPGQAGEVEQHVVTVLGGPVDAVTWDGESLTITSGDQGLVFDVS